MKSMEESEARKAILDAMIRANTPPELIYAFKKTGRIVTEDNMKNLTAEELAEWEAPIAEYKSLH